MRVGESKRHTILCLALILTFFLSTYDIAVADDNLGETLGSIEASSQNIQENNLVLSEPTSGNENLFGENSVITSRESDSEGQPVEPAIDDGDKYDRYNENEVGVIAEDDSTDDTSDNVELSDENDSDGDDTGESAADNGDAGQVADSDGKEIAEEDTGPVDAQVNQPQGDEKAADKNESQLKLKTFEQTDSAPQEQDVQQIVKDGWYYLQSTKSILLSLTGEKSTKKINLSTDKASGSQRWYLAYNASKKAFTLKHFASSLYLAVKDAKANSKVRLAPSATSEKCLWIISKDSSGGYILKSVFSGLYLDANSGKSFKSGVGVDTAKEAKAKGKTANYQRWYLLPIAPDYSASTATLADGTYSISLNKANKKSMTVLGSSQAENKQLTSTEYIASMCQKFIIHKNDDDTYSLQSLTSAKYLTTVNGKVVQMKLDPSDEAAKWRAVRMGNSSISFINVATNKAMAIAGASTADGALAVAASPSNVPAQRFTLKKRYLLDNGNFYLRIGNNTDNAKVVTIKSGSKKSGAKVVSEKQTFYNDYGTFKVKYLGNGVYTFVNYNSGKALRVTNGVLTQGANSGNAAKWLVTPSPNGGVTITNLATETILSAGSKAGSTLCVASSEDKYTQSFYAKQAQILKPYQKLALKKVIERGSRKNYYFVGDLGVARLMLWHRANRKSEWTLKFDVIISYGRIEHGTTLTPLVDGDIRAHTRWLDSHGMWRGKWSAPYAVRWCKTAYFHSPTHYYYHSSREIDPRLGLPISSGCIRVPNEYAKWIFEHYGRLYGSSVTVWKNGKYHW